ncbi:MAG: CDP-diacylglycerol--glycerol-3-phosphate 3-phosphatidyltransferase [bacterium]|nr:CDP-diacylglycerol--glycerol-3-phosphate 3-phosphatidyltransferase [bacterium]
MSTPVVDLAARGAQVTTLPNLLSLFRIALVPIVIVVLLWPGPGPSALAGFIFFTACITDFLDGWIARRNGITTALGKFLDPLADKLIVVGVLIMLAGMSPEPRVPAWMAAVIALRELAVTGLRSLASASGVVVPAEELGKYKMIFQMFALEGLLLHYEYAIPGTGLRVDFHAAGMVLLWVALVLAVWSAVDYYVRVLRRVPLY